MKIGLFYGSSTCYTQFVAEKMVSLIGEDNVDLHNVETSPVQSMLDYDLLIFGIPTWDFGELQEDWDNIWDDMESVDLTGKTCAIFGLGDQVGYADWFQDAMGYLYFKLVSMGAKVVGAWPNEGYEFNESKGLNQTNNMFYGLPLDEENQPDLTEDRLKMWLAEIL